MLCLSLYQNLPLFVCENIVYKIITSIIKDPFKFYDFNIETTG